MEHAAAFATLCTAGANARLLHHSCRTPLAPVPASVVSMQVLANAAWITHAATHGDLYLCLTAAMSLAMQAVSLALLVGRRGGTQPLSETADD